MSPLSCLLPAALAACCLLVSVQGQASLLAGFLTAELECFAKKQVLYSGDNKCYQLRARGPCLPGEWLVLDKYEAENGTGEPVPVCQTHHCNRVPLTIYWPADGQCYKTATDGKKLCPRQGTVFEADMFGEGHCPCKKAHIHMAHNNPNGPCYPIQQRGPCPIREFVVPQDYAAIIRLGTCVRNNCSNHVIRTGKPYVQYSKNMRCYVLDTVGPCLDTDKLQISEVTLQPECTSPVNSTFDLEPRCQTDTTSEECDIEVRAAFDLGARCMEDPTTKECVQTIHFIQDQTPANQIEEMMKALCKPGRSKKRPRCSRTQL